MVLVFLLAVAVSVVYGYDSCTMGDICDDGRTYHYLGYCCDDLDKLPIMPLSDPYGECQCIPRAEVCAQHPELC
ncbi:hypothetical protein ElyMa_005626800 [Elysia marginata]|uniref:Uncharacterized protein n=1 Tax=Elysia marginata TaxID=1093978 RepID=A0AAV4F7C4_9GAST|nr:hypothetical protein ElyMa_005626800 [Elysia marginata]